MVVDSHVCVDSEDVLEKYLTSMVRLGVDKLVVHSIHSDLAGCRARNDQVAGWCEEYPDLIVGFATAPLALPEDAVGEIDRAVKDLGLKGLKIYPKFQGVRLDSPELRPVFRKASKLNIPILTHCDSYPFSYTGSKGWLPSNTPPGIDHTACNPGRLFRTDFLDDYPT